MKTHEEEATKLRRALRERGGARGKRFEPALKARVIEFAVQRRNEGASWMTIATELGACFETLRRWCSATAAIAPAAPPSILPVKIVADTFVATVERTTMKLVTPNGLRVEGASVEEIAALVRALG